MDEKPAIQSQQKPLETFSDLASHIRDSEPDVMQVLAPHVSVNIESEMNPPPP
jgi:hypothetical protein